ncbi:MAG: hypothetical protein K8T90_22080 [Planctomycetes bacterium]|nr:hypothetical protein [Planctomycetota bacterium]
MTTATTDPLDGLTVAVPCTESWDAMAGDERRRFCAKCRLHVHDLSAMTRPEALAFLASSTGKTACVRFARRPDGRVTTRDCRDAITALRRRSYLTAAAVVGALGLGATALALVREAEAGGGWSNPDLWEKQPFATIAHVLPASWVPARAQNVMGR